MRKITRFCSTIMALAMPIMLLADGQVKSKEISSDYARNSISNIFVSFDDSWDAQVREGFRAYDVSAKFDENDIVTELIGIDGTRSPESGQFPAPYAAAKDAITEHLNSFNIGKQIFDYALAVDDKGMFHYDILTARSRWNATDEDVHLDNASQVKTIEQNGPALLANSYIIVYDARNAREVQEEKKDGTKVPVWKANVSAYVFAIDGAEDIIGQVLHNMWIYDTDEESVKAEKRAAYQNLKVPLKCVAAVGAPVSSKKSMAAAIAGAQEKLIPMMENKIPTWRVASGLESVKPYITAKIGTKEGIKNGQRFKIFRNYGDRDAGEQVKTKKVGFARATVVNNNNSEATGETGVSYFYQISGYKLKSTEFLKQSNDSRVGLSIGYNYNGLGWNNQKVFGAFNMAEVTVDYLAYIHKNGISHYARFKFGYDILTKNMLRDGLAAKQHMSKSDAASRIDQTVYKNGLSFGSVAIGYACGLKAGRFFELQPTVDVGAEMAIFHKKGALTKKEKKSNYGVFVDPALRFVFNCGYPFQVYIQADYSLMVYEGDTHKNINKYLNLCGKKRDMGLGIGAGVKWTF